MGYLSSSRINYNEVNRFRCLLLSKVHEIKLILCYINSLFKKASSFYNDFSSLFVFNCKYFNILLISIIRFDQNTINLH